MVWVVCLGAAACLAFTFGAVGFAVAMFGGLLGASGAGCSSSGYLLLGLFCFVGATLISPMVGFGPGTIGVFFDCRCPIIQGTFGCVRRTSC